MKILVTGGAGFIGSHVVELLVENGHEAVIVDNLETGRREFIDSGIRFYKLDILSPKMEYVFEVERPDVVIHLAAQVDVAKSVENPMKDAYSNIIGTLNLLSCCQKYQVKKVVYSSSCAVYGDAPIGPHGISESAPVHPLTFYGVSKYAPELYISVFQQLYGLSYTILRYANVYGPRQTPKGEGGVISIFTTKMLKGEQPIIFGDGEQTRDFIFVKDVAAANVRAADPTRGNNCVLNVGSNKSTSINRLYEIIASSLSVRPAPQYVAKRDGDIRDSLLDNRQAIAQLIWKPEYELERGLAETIDYYRRHF